MAAQLRACTFNVRYGEPADGENAWPYRREAAVETVQSIDPDVLGLQEPMEHQVAYLRSRLPGFGWYGLGREGGERPERDPVAWRTRRFEVEDRATHWLSPTPDRRGSVGWDAARPRFVTRVSLRDRETDRRVTVFNAHLDHAGERARQEGARLLAEWAAEVEHPIVLADCNAEPGSPPYDALTERLRDARLVADEVAGPAETFHGFDGSADRRIDYAFVGDGVDVRTCETVTAAPGGRAPSDHYPLVADLLVG